MDPLRFKQVLSNLISNALKFTEQGQVVIKVRLSPADRDHVLQMHLEVNDSGIGIGPADLQRLFEPLPRSITPAGWPATARGWGW